MASTIGILGSGIVGKTLAAGFLSHGYEVMIGSGSGEKRAELAASLDSRIRVGDFAETAGFGSLLVLAVKGAAAPAVLEQCGATELDGKTILDATNPIADAPPVNGVLQYTTTLGSSLMEQLQQQVPGARFVKAFSSIGSAHMVNPDFGGERPTMFICGNDAAAKQEAAAILTQFGHEVEDMGSVEAARAIEPLAILWCIPGFLRNQWSHAFRLLKK